MKKSKSGKYKSTRANLAIIGARHDKQLKLQTAISIDVRIPGDLSAF